MPEGPRLRTNEAAELAGVKPSTWRDYVADGRAPKPDGRYDERSPYWFESTVDDFKQHRPGRGRRRAEVDSSASRAPRRVFTPEFKAQTVQEYHASGQSMRQFALAHDLTQSALATWIRDAEAGKLPGS
ncbi:transposase [Kribbella sp. NPDC050820]|uniref:transposase n=1 Tax=Kribbella sp. NPDC050820 TaxID=3155408 RepID=UPI00340815AF